ncbi:MAG TPA: DUF4446 family protein [Actinomycetota bacterium]|nr:DUF4446 family protein [Actinomycetota bacterium]
MGRHNRATVWRLKYPMGSPKGLAEPTMNRDTVILIFAASAGLALVALFVALSAHSKLATARKAYAVLQATSDGRTILDAVATYGKDLKVFEDGLNKLIERQNDLALAMKASIRNVALVRYDAFEDMGGRLSFSAALVDDHGSGLVLSAISGRAEARAYAKIVEEGESEAGLSPEEQQVIGEAIAMAGRKRTRPKVKATRR